MSDQTPDTTQGTADDNEPSMEDILASIRKIIADDGEDDIALEAVGAVTQTADPIDDVAMPVVSELTAFAPFDSLMEENLVVSAPEIIDSPADIEIPAPADDEAVLDLEIAFTEDDAAQEAAAPKTFETSAPMVDDELSSMLDSLTDEAAPTEEPVSDDEGFDMAALVDDTEEATEEEASETLDFATSQEESDMDLVKSLMAELTEKPYSIDDEEAVGELSDVQASDVEAPKTETPDIETPDIEIQDIQADAFETTELEDLFVEMDALEAPEVPVTAQAQTALPDIQAPAHDVDEALQESLASLTADEDDTSDMMDEILNMTLEDEVNLQESAYAPEISQETPQPPVTENAGPMSLQDIAQAAQSEADALDGGAALTALGGGLALGAAAGHAFSAPGAEEQGETMSALQEPDGVESLLSRLDNIIETPVIEEELSDEALSDLEALEISEEMSELDEEIIELEAETNHTEDLSNPDTITEETPQMPRAAKSETIIDEVTETATAGAFASLNQAVEEKAVVAERGDRIGDLVMESLRPMLKEWLDANLKGIVERAVTKEVKRISSGK